MVSHKILKGYVFNTCIIPFQGRFLICFKKFQALARRILKLFMKLVHFQEHTAV